MRHYAMAFRISISAVGGGWVLWVAVRDGIDLRGVVREFCGVDPWRPARFEREFGKRGDAHSGRHQRLDDDHVVTGVCDSRREAGARGSRAPFRRDRSGRMAYGQPRPT